MDVLTITCERCRRTIKNTKDVIPLRNPLGDRFGGEWEPFAVVCRDCDEEREADRACWDVERRWRRLREAVEARKRAGILLFRVTITVACVAFWLVAGVVAGAIWPGIRGEAGLLALGMASACGFGAWVLTMGRGR